MNMNSFILSPPALMPVLVICTLVKKNDEDDDVDNDDDDETPLLHISLLRINVCY